jgi:hypothetical protein
VTHTMSADWHCHDRIGLAQLVRIALTGGDILRVRQELTTRREEPGASMDLAVIEQLLGNRDLGLNIQREALERSRCFRSLGNPTSPRLRVLALAAPLDIGGNTPIEFLIQSRDIELKILYVMPGSPLGESLPDHDVAIVISSNDSLAEASFEQIRVSLPSLRRPLLNAPDRVAQTERDQLFTLIEDIPGLHINPTAQISRHDLAAVADGQAALPFEFPIIARPTGSHAGNGLELLRQSGDVERYLTSRTETDFFISPFTDYSNEDGLFRKYRIVFVDGRAFACHMAISHQWAIWYLNAEMAGSASKRREEEHFITQFERDFGARHKLALAEFARRLGLEYFVIDCAETKDGQLLVFEAGTAMIVHDLDPSDLFPYKPPQMQLVSAAFEAMLERYANRLT